MGDWYTIGVMLGVGLGLGMIVSGLLAANALRVALAVALGLAAGALAGYVVGDTAETVAGAVGGALGALAAAAIVIGARRRGATRIGLVAYVGAAGILVLLLALIPIAGYVLAVVLPALAARLRGRQAERFAGLRTLAK